MVQQAGNFLFWCFNSFWNTTINLGDFSFTLGDVIGAGAAAWLVSEIFSKIVLSERGD